MQLNVQVRFYTADYPWLCFRHAIEEAVKGVEVSVEVDDYHSDHYMGQTHCELCAQGR